MGKISLIVSDKVEIDFRNTVFKKFGMKRGNMTKAAEEALKDWIKNNANSTVP